MRVIIFTAAAAAAFAVSGCNGEQTANDTAAVNETAEIQAIGGNDTTAIDAATNDAANMAEDANLLFNLPDNGSDTNETDNRAAGNRVTNNAD